MLPIAVTNCMAVLSARNAIYILLWSKDRIGYLYNCLHYFSNTFFPTFLFLIVFFFIFIWFFFKASFASKHVKHLLEVSPLYLEFWQWQGHKIFIEHQLLTNFVQQCIWKDQYWPLLLSPYGHILHCKPVLHISPCLNFWPLEPFGLQLQLHNRCESTQ